jgi:hypothetical protein
MPEDCYAAISSYDSGWDTSAVAIRSLFCPWKCFCLSYERCSPLSFFGDRSSVLFSPPTHLQTSSIIILLLLSIQVGQSSRASMASSIQQHVHRWHHLPIIAPFVSFHPISGRPAMVGSLMVPRQIVAFGGALKSYQIISSYFVQCVSGSHDSFSGRGSEGEGSGLRCIRVASRVRLKPAGLR